MWTANLNDIENLGFTRGQIRYFCVLLDGAKSNHENVYSDRKYLERDCLWSIPQVKVGVKPL